MRRVDARPDPADLRARLAERDERAAQDTRTEAERFLGDPPSWRAGDTFLRSVTGSTRATARRAVPGLIRLFQMRHMWRLPPGVGLHRHHTWPPAACEPKCARCACGQHPQTPQRRWRNWGVDTPFPKCAPARSASDRCCRKRARL